MFQDLYFSAGLNTKDKECLLVRKDCAGTLSLQQATIVVILVYFSIVFRSMLNVERTWEHHFSTLIFMAVFVDISSIAFTKIEDTLFVRHWCD